MRTNFILQFAQYRLECSLAVTLRAGSRVFLPFLSSAQGLWPVQGTQPVTSTYLRVPVELSPPLSATWQNPWVRGKEVSEVCRRLWAVENSAHSAQEAETGSFKAVGRSSSPQDFAPSVISISVSTNCLLTL